MNRTSYNCVEGWKVDLMLVRARRLGFRGHDLEDALQDIVLDVMAFVFDPAKSNGATEQTALTSLVDNKLKTIRRGKCRAQARLERIPPRTESDEEIPQRQFELALDAREVLAKLPAEYQEVCRELCGGNSQRAIAARRGWSWRKMQWVLEEIRQAFTQAGLAPDHLISS